jgi:hypothetical protein
MTLFATMPGIAHRGGPPRIAHPMPHAGFGSLGRQHFASGGTTSPGVPFNQGLLHSVVPGRTDKLPVDLPNGAYVLPADVVSGIGEGNTTAGASILDGMFSGAPHGETRGPHNAMQAQVNRGYGPPMAPPSYQMAAGGVVAHEPRAKIIAAGGEYVVHPDAVARIGHGDIKKGHDILDAFVKHVRNRTVKTMQKLPGPKKK